MPYNSTLKAALQAAITTPANPKISGTILQQQLLAMVNAMEAGAVFMGAATPATSPTGEANCFYLAATEGVYNNFLDIYGHAITIGEGEAALLSSIYENNSLRWKKNSFPGRTYLHIMYSVAQPAQDSDIHATLTNGDKWIGICADLNNTAPTKYDAYQWAKFVGEDGEQGTPGHNPNCGTYTNIADAPATGQAGDYIVLVSGDPETGIIYKWDDTANDNAGGWVSTGLAADDAAWDGGQLLAVTKIDDDLNNGLETNVASAKAAMLLKQQLRGVTLEETKVAVVTSGTGQNTYNGYIDGSTGAYASSSYNSFIIVELGTNTRVRWLAKENASNSSNLGWAFGTFSGEINATLSNFTALSSGVYADNPSDNQAVEYIKEAPEGATHAVITIWRYKTGGGSAVTLDNFYCYTQNGKSVVTLAEGLTGDEDKALSQKALFDKFGTFKKVNYQFAIDIPRIPTNSNAFYCSISSTLNVPYYHSRLIPVSSGEKYKIVADNSFGVSRYAFVGELTDEELALIEDGSETGSVVSGKIIAVPDYDGGSPNALHYMSVIDGVYKNKSPKVVEIPDGCHWLCVVYSGYNDNINNIIAPTVYKFQLDFSANMLEEHKIDFLTEQLLDGYAISQTTFNWYYLNNYRSFVIPVVPGQVFTIEKTTPEVYQSRYAFLRSIPDFTQELGAADIIEVNTIKIHRLGVPQGYTKSKFIIPNGCKYLYIQASAGGNNFNSLPNSLSYINIDNNINNVSEDTSIDFHNEYLRSSAVGLSESNPIPLINEKVYECSTSASQQVKSLTIADYFGVGMRIIAKFANKNTNANPTLSINGGTAKAIYYNGQPASNTNSWKSGELVWLQYDGENYIFTSYDSTQIEGTDSVAVSTTTQQQNNVLKLANRYRFIKWTPKTGQTVIDGFTVGIPQHDHSGNLSYKTATQQEYGCPYSSASQDQKYIGLNVSIHTFLTAVNNPFSLLYTETIKNGASRSAWNRVYHASNGSTYFGLVCCGFTAAVTGYKRNWNNGDFPFIANQGMEFVKVAEKTINPQSIKVGDVFDNPSHSIVIYQIFQDVYTGKVTHVRFAECTSHVFGCRFCLMTIDAFVEKYMATYEYSQYRCIKLYQNNLGDEVLDEWLLQTDPQDINLNYSHIATDVIGTGRNGDVGDNDVAEQPQIDYNNEICTIAGDKATFPIGDYSIGNIIALNYNLDGNSLGSYDRIKIYKRTDSASEYQLAQTTLLNEIDKSNLINYLKDNTLLLSRPTDSTSVGQYYACLANSLSDSDKKTYWEVLDNPTTITEENSNYHVSWEGDVVALQMLKIHSSEAPDPDPYFEGLGDTDVLRNQSLVGLSDYDIKRKKTTLEQWRFDGVDASQVYIRLLTRGIYGITGVYVKLVD